jgi:toxin FitB
LIILDTNVISELMRVAPDPVVVDWLDRQPPESICITAVTLFESRLALALMPAGRRQRLLQAAFDRLLADDLGNRVLAFDAEAAVHAAALSAARQRAGRPVDVRDTQIAGIAQSRRATLATRNVRYFEGLKTAVLNPWPDADQEL